MIGPTHMIGGNFAYLAVAWWVGHPPRPSEAVVAMLAALLPDLDSPRSPVGRRLPALAAALVARLGRRGATHSLAAVLLVAALATLLPEGFRLAFVTGFASHALLDMMTPSGVAWFWPIKHRCVLPGDRRWRMDARGRGELGFAVLLTLLTGPVACAGERGVGVLGTIRDAIGDIAQARRYYDDHRGEAAWWLTLDGVDNRQGTAIDGRYRVIGGYRADGLLLHTPSGARSVCRSDACDWHARHAVLERGHPEQTTVRWLRGQHMSAEALLDAIDPLHAVGELYLLGELTGRRLYSDPPTIVVSGGAGTPARASLHYASPVQLLSQPGPFQSVDLLIQVRHAPGSVVPQPRLPELSAQPRIDPRLRRYLP